MAKNEVTKADAEVMAEGTGLVPVRPEMEFRLINPTEGGFLRRIEWNRAELEAAVREKVAEYEGIVYTDDTIQAAKADRATLNKLTKAIEDRRKTVKKIINAPYETFEGELKEILSLIQEPVGIIDAKVKDYENRQKEEKRERIREAYEAAAGDLAKVITFEQLFDARYLNATYALAKAVEEITGKVERVRTDLQTIDEMCSDYKTNAQDVYLKTLDLSKAMAEEKRLRELKEKMEADRRAKEEAERRRIEEEKRLREEEERRREEERQRREAEDAAAMEAARRRAVQAAPWQADAGNQEPESQDDGAKAQSDDGNSPDDTDNAGYDTEKGGSDTGNAVPATEKRYRAAFWCEGTLEDIKALGAYMREHNIKYGKVER